MRDATMKFIGGTDHCDKVIAGLKQLREHVILCRGRNARPRIGFMRCLIVYVRAQPRLGRYYERTLKNTRHA